MREALGAVRPHYVVVNGIKLAYDDEGTGPVLLCLHAIGHGAGDYVALRERVKHRYRVIALDWPGHGRSEGESDTPGDERYAVHLEAFVHALGLERFILLGNSVGGGAAIRFAARHSDKVRALIVINSAGLFARVPIVPWFIRLLSRYFFGAGVRRRRWYPRAFAAYYRRMLRGDAAAEQRQRIIDSAYEQAPLLAAAWHQFAEPSADVRHLAERVRCPVLVVWATLDPANHLWVNRPGIARFRDMQLITFRAGHSPFLEMPDEFVPAMHTFLDRVLELNDSAAHASRFTPATGVQPRRTDL